MFKEIVENIVLKKDETSEHDWMLITSLFSIPKDVNKIVISYLGINYYWEKINEDTL